MGGLAKALQREGKGKGRGRGQGKDEEVRTNACLPQAWFWVDVFSVTTGNNINLRLTLVLLRSWFSPPYRSHGYLGTVRGRHRE